MYANGTPINTPPVAAQAARKPLFHKKPKKRLSMVLWASGERLQIMRRYAGSANDAPTTRAR
jgi:hypothetical protein